MNITVGLGPTNIPRISQQYEVIQQSKYKRTNKQTNKIGGLSTRATYTGQATAACRRS
jgi:hypothetical protein